MASDHGQVRRADVIDHAEATALYFRRLVEEGVPIPAATSMASQYGIGLMAASIQMQRPREPWEGLDGEPPR